jgi:predicted enzyme related to lactoylglutathione lyase
MTTPQLIGAVLYAKDPERLAAFYSAVTGLRITNRQESFFVVGSPSAQLVIVQIPKRIADAIAIETPPIRRERASIKLVFSIENIEEGRAKAAELGGELNQSNRQWEFEGAKVCDGHDPEGNVFQLRHAL